MRAYKLTNYGSTKFLQLLDVEKPSPVNDEILIKVKATSINDWDWATVNGSPFYIRLLCGLFKPKIKILGVDVAGEVVAVGPEVRHFRVGDRVYGDLSERGFGAFADYVCKSEQSFLRMPSSMNYQEAAAVPHAAGLALQSLKKLGELTTESVLLVNGAGGGVGVLAAQFAKALGVKSVIGVDSRIKFEVMNTAGYDQVYDYHSADFTKHKNTYDFILDCKTNRSAFAYLNALKSGGRYITVGGNTGHLLRLLFLSPIVNSFTKKHLSILALKPNQDLEVLNEWFAAGLFRTYIDRLYPFDNLPEAVDRFGEAVHQGKVVVTVD